MAFTRSCRFSPEMNRNARFVPVAVTYSSMAQAPEGLQVSPSFLPFPRLGSITQESWLSSARWRPEASSVHKIPGRSQGKGSCRGAGAGVGDGQQTPHATAAEAHNRLMLTKAMDLSAARKCAVPLPITPKELAGC
jgi:hypothetical protein